MSSFDLACDIAHTIPKVPYNYDKLLDLYGLYQTISVGKVNINKPNMLKVRSVKKWNAWKRWEDTSIDEAKEKYTKIVAVWKLQKNQE